MARDPELPDDDLPPNAVELLRAWVQDGDLHCQMNIGAVEDDDASVVFAVLLADVARHVAEAVEKAEGTPASETLAHIRQHFNLELDSPTAETGGGFVC